MSFSRTDRSVLGRWWWTVDRWALAAIAILVIVGVILLFAASPPSAARIGLDRYHFVRSQFVYLPLSLAMMIGVSLLDVRTIKRVAVIIFIGALLATALTPLIGPQYKGAHRWLSIMGMSLQPSEILKPSFAVFTAWMFSQQKLQPNFPGNAIAIATLFLVVLLLAAQPDMGMTAVIVAVWLVQFFLAGLPVVWIAGLSLILGFGAVAAYQMLPHVQHRVNNFLDSSQGDNYQIDRSLEAFSNGGLFGRGPGEGTVKAALPDAHSDFVFAVAGEEFGLVVCLLVVLLYGFVVLRGFARVFEETSFFVLLATSGLLAIFGVQAVINMASTLHLIPTKGMTLPFLSYGGSSLMGLALGMGMVLALTRRRTGLEDVP